MFIEKHQPKKWVFACAVIPILLLTCVGVQPAGATSFKLADFIEIPAEKVIAFAPKLVTAFSDARFFLAGLTSVSGEWNFVRAEGEKHCDGDICPTVVFFAKSEWTILLNASREIAVTINLDAGESIEFGMKVTGGKDVLIRYNNGDRVIYIVN